MWTTRVEDFYEFAATAAATSSPRATTTTTTTTLWSCVKHFVETPPSERDDTVFNFANRMRFRFNKIFDFVRKICPSFPVGLETPFETQGLYVNPVSGESLCSDLTNALLLEMKNTCTNFFLNDIYGKCIESMGHLCIPEDLIGIEKVFDEFYLENDDKNVHHHLICLSLISHHDDETKNQRYRRYHQLIVTLGLLVCDIFNGEFYFQKEDVSPSVVSSSLDIKICNFKSEELKENLLLWLMGKLVCVSALRYPKVNVIFSSSKTSSSPNAERQLKSFLTEAVKNMDLNSYCSSSDVFSSSPKTGEIVFSEI